MRTFFACVFVGLILLSAVAASLIPARGDEKKIHLVWVSDPNPARKEQIAQFNEMFPEGELITFCPTCTIFLKEEYGRPVKHALQFIAERLADASPKNLDLKATYHDPCPLSRGAEIIEEPREILKAIGVDVVEMPLSKNTSRCCGGGGGIITSAPELSGRLAVSRAEQAAATGADTVVTVCPTCELTLRSGAQAIGGNGDGLKVANLLDLVWKAIK